MLQLDNPQQSHIEQWTLGKDISRVGSKCQSNSVGIETNGLFLLLKFGDSINYSFI